MRKRIIEGTEREYLLVEYAENGLLFVPIHQADRLTRFVGPDEVPPKMSALGKQDVWTRTKEKARKAAMEEARELLGIYAQRAATPGFAFSVDSAWQRELEASFPYVETEDQLRVIREIKADMETHMPMDRLVCGDVGYGKTEVALRAAFKAVADGRQVAVLVPTTVLADQHYHTFSTRMESFPIKIELLSRFRTKAEQSKALTALANGKVDIMIGTHRLLSDDVTFKNLGLVIVDEEQRFGVKHKEHFKKLRAVVDVLTLTATPIPRTLYMTLSGVRDISMLQTPPEDRLPVITHVGGFDPRLIRQAILREIDRGGQIFVIHNRVKTIDALRERLESIVPEASVIVGHGQMSGRHLERVITEFGQGKYDILLATSIIESGIDMPNVNTLIVDRADWFGMAQLYQLRGRVGRSATQAYSYFFHGGSTKLTEEARARLETLAEYTHLGSGFQISVRDLELRGAGDILSTKQTGHVAVVGLQLYTQLLQQAVSELKGETTGKPAPTYEQERMVIDLPLPAYIPHDWIQEMALRLQLYRRIGSLQTVQELDAMAQELLDRFGVLPKAVEGLLYQIRVKLMGAAINATAIIKPRQHILIKLPWLAAVDREALALRLGDDVEVSRTAVELALDSADRDNIWQLRLLDVLQELRQGIPAQVGAE
jgi:transcription-repair coupling factor (superfamily II helicase)